MLFLAIILFGCTKTGQQTDAEHAHEVKLKLTEYSDNMEVFAETDPFAVGQNSSILAHFSWLENFKPLETGEVTISLIVGTSGVKQTLSQCLRPGIYKFEIQPQKAGVGKIIFEINSDKGKTKIIVNNITVYKDKHDADHAAEEIVVSATNTTVFTKEQSWKTDFATNYPKEEPFGQVIKTTAQVLSSQGDEVIVSAKSNGMVLLSDNNVLEGKSVSAGQVLFTLSGNGLADNNSAVKFVEAQNNYEKVKADYDRAKELAKDKIVSEKDLLIAKNQYDNAKVIYDNLNKNFNSSGQTVSSSMSGFVKQLYVKNGQYVEAGQPIVSISQNKTLLLRAEVQQKYANILGTIKIANIRTLYDNKTYTLEELNGKVLSYGRNTNTDNYLIPVSIQIDNKRSFISGGFVELYLKTMTNSQAITIPNNAILEDQENFFVYVQVNPELFEKREVFPGGTDGIRTEITKGIAANERIVTTGAMLIKLAQATGTLDSHSGHVH